MTDSGKHSWDEVINGLRTAASELRSAAGRPGAPSTEETAAEARLKHDLEELQSSSAELMANLGHSFGQKREGIESSFDKKGAAQSANQMRSALEDLAKTASNLAADVASAASSSLKQAEPELRNSVRDLEEVAGSAAAWVRAAFEPDGGRHERPDAGRDRPLDDL